MRGPAKARASRSVDQSGERSVTERANDASGARVEWLHQLREGDAPSYRMGRQGPSLVAEWAGARVACDPDGSNVRVSAVAGGRRPREKSRALALALVGDLKGGLALHASSVALGTRCVAILGESEAGKSTAAAELCLRYGGLLLSDDVALLVGQGGVVQVTPTERQHFLSPRSGKALGVRIRNGRLGPRGKAAIRPMQAASRGYPLALLVSLKFDDSLDGPACRSLHGAEAAQRVISSLFRFDLGNRADELDRVLGVYRQAPLIEIARPRGRPSVCEAIFEALKAINDR